MLVPWYISFTKILFMNLCIEFVATRIINKKRYNIANVFIILIINILVAFLYCKLRNNFTITILYPIYYFICMLIICVSEKLEIEYGFTLTAISIAFSYISMLIATILNFFILSIANIEITNQNVLEYISIGCIQLILLFLFFKIKRFKDGFSFLRDNNKIIGIIISIIIIILSIVIGFYNNELIRTILTISLLAGGFLMIKWIRKRITKFYKKQMMDRTVELQKEELEEKEQIIKDLKDELNSALKINHEYSHRISSMDNIIKKLKLNEEVANDNSEIIECIERLSREFKSDVSEMNKTHKTGVMGIDNILEYMSGKALKENISLEVEIKCNIKELLEKEINQSNLETLLADHINNSIIAIKHGNKKINKIKVVFDKTDGVYEVKIYDTGIEFEIDTLLKLGMEQITTHKDTGGTGIGFMTTFATLKECRGSFVIEEYKPMEEEYTKAIIIVFDEKYEYRIHSYRAKEIKRRDINNRIRVKENE